MNKKPLALFGLKWNPFSPDVPVEALFVTPEVRNFCWRVENLVREGGFALIAGAPGLGKSIAMRLVAERLASLRDVVVGAIEHPRSRTADFYRELAHIFGVPLAPHNRWGGFKALRDKWHAHIESTTVRPVLLIDEAQEMPPPAFAELRLLASSHFDSRSLLTVVLVGDHRLPELLRSDELLPLASRLRVRLTVEPASKETLRQMLEHLLEQAGNPKLMTPELINTLCDHAAGNYRLLCTTANELLNAGVQREVKQLDEKLYLEVFSPGPDRARKPPAQTKMALTAR